MTEVELLTSEDAGFEDFFDRHYARLRSLDCGARLARVETPRGAIWAIVVPRGAVDLVRRTVGTLPARSSRVRVETP